MTIFKYGQKYNDLIINKLEGKNRELMKFFPRGKLYFIHITRKTNQSKLCYR